MGPIPAHCTTLRSELDSVADLSTLVSKFLSDDKRKNAVMCCYEDKNFMLFGMIPMQRHHCRCCQNSICDNHTRYVKFLPTGNIDGNQANNNSYESYNVCADNSDLQCVKLCTECVNILDDFSKKSAKDADTQLTDVSKLSNENSGPVPIVKEAEKLEVVNIPVSETVNTTALVVEEAEKKEVVNTPVSETTNTTSPIVEEAEKKEVEKTPEMLEWEKKNRGKKGAVRDGRTGL